MHMIWQCYSVAVGTAGGVVAAFCGRFAAPFFAAFREAFTGTLLTAFLAAGVCWALAALAASALTLAQRLLVASAMAFLPAALSFRFALGASGVTGDGGSDSFLDSAHRFRWASPMRLRAAALILRRLPFGASDKAAVSVGVPVSIWRSSTIWVSIRLFCSSNPRMAALSISAVSLWVGIRISMARLTLYVTTILHRRTYRTRRNTQC